jgi:hypothetical protein
MLQEVRTGVDASDEFHVEIGEKYERQNALKNAVKN